MAEGMMNQEPFPDRRSLTHMEARCNLEGFVERPLKTSAAGQPVRTSIVIVSYNHQDKLLKCLRSVLHSMPPDCELIVIDNDSTEGNVAAVSAEFPDVTLLKSDRNVGFGAAANRAAAAARGAFLAFLNPDTIVEPGWLASLVSRLDREDGVGLVTPRILIESTPHLINTCGCDVNLTGLSTCRGLNRERGSYPHADQVGAVSGAAFVIRKTLFDQLHGFDQDMFLYMEDIDLSWRAGLAGWRTLYVPESIVYHDYELKITRLKIFWQERNRYLMLLKCMKWRTLIVMSPAYLLAEGVTWGFVFLRDRKNLANKISAMLWIVSNWKLIRAKRLETQRIRTTTDRSILKTTKPTVDFSQGGGRLAGAVAAAVFNPLFFAARAFSLAVVWW
jgi:GT2 family glycosyltransferase